MAKYKVIEQHGSNKPNVLAVSEDYYYCVNTALQKCKDYTNSEFFLEIQQALEERGYYMCGWSSVKISIIEG